MPVLVWIAGGFAIALAMKFFLPSSGIDVEMPAGVSGQTLHIKTKGAKKIFLSLPIPPVAGNGTRIVLNPPRWVSAVNNGALVQIGMSIGDLEIPLTEPSGTIVAVYTTDDPLTGGPIITTIQYGP